MSKRKRDDSSAATATITTTTNGNGSGSGSGDAKDVKKAEVEISAEEMAAIARYKVADFKRRLKALGLPVSGIAIVLRNRLFDALTAGMKPKAADAEDDAKTENKRKTKKPKKPAESESESESESEDDADADDDVKAKSKTKSKAKAKGKAKGKAKKSAASAAADDDHADDAEEEADGELTAAKLLPPVSTPELDVLGDALEKHVKARGSARTVFFADAIDAHAHNPVIAALPEADRGYRYLRYEVALWLLVLHSRSAKGGYLEIAHSLVGDWLTGGYSKAVKKQAFKFGRNKGLHRPNHGFWNQIPRLLTHDLGFMLMNAAPVALGSGPEHSDNLKKLVASLQPDLILAKVAERQKLEAQTPPKFG